MCRGRGNREIYPVRIQNGEDPLLRGLYLEKHSYCALVWHSMGGGLNLTRRKGVPTPSQEKPEMCLVAK